MQTTTALLNRLRKEVSRTYRRNARVYPGFSEALQQCPRGGYESALIAAVVRAKTEKIRTDRDLCESSMSPTTRAGIPLISLIARLLLPNASDIRVLDFGGACGAHYFLARQLAPGLRFRWCVVETDAMIEQGSLLADTCLTFARNVTAAQELLGGVDLLHSSGTLQYLPSPQATLGELLRVNAHLVALTRLSLTDGEPFTVVQKSRLSNNGPGPLPRGFRDSTVAYPLTIINRASFEKEVGKDYRIIARYRDESADHVTPRGAIRGLSYLCLRNDKDFL
ncbi:MAG: methyltransferase, TIGR04325 family [Bryobacterales bacterium]|nr:methyltransferase, TIGR04325 family [Bryobacterales bacterium]